MSTTARCDAALSSPVGHRSCVKKLTTWKCKWVEFSSMFNAEETCAEHVLHFHLRKDMICLAGNPSLLVFPLLSCAYDYLALIQEDYCYCVSRHWAMREACTVFVLVLLKSWCRRGFVQLSVACFCSVAGCYESSWQPNRGQDGAQTKPKGCLWTLPNACNMDSVSFPWTWFLSLSVWSCWEIQDYRHLI